MSRMRRVARIVLISLTVGAALVLGGTAASADDTIWNIKAPDHVQAAQMALLDTIWN
ncbi:hypothetical protein [Kitasatospora cineracea]|uniref:Uncharacterized protein n=1 Tax=Kitasatospora cineracea TaxID=88074 RepID=A0A3N4S4F0_9ACTN|nr:hypothetical protein [Kitasatospora cineracea]ROR43318.1 hypothetical protein EDD39_1464 [Kitasatospora cineracea]RPE33690.1 hypothetical protein EDD38_1985 [Kitasatospora cineracea]